MLLRMAENVTQLILCSTENIDLFVTKTVAHITDHHRITALLLSAHKALFEKANLMNLQSSLNNYFTPIFEAAISTFMREDMIKNNLQGITSLAINEIAEKCDHENLRDPLFT